MQSLSRSKVYWAWAMYDWANSAFALVITAAVFPFYFSSQIDDNFTIGKLAFTDESILSYCITAAFLLLIICIPLLSGMADYGGRRLFFMKVFTYLGGIACISMYFFEGHQTLWIAFVGYALANVGFGGALVFYNSFLPRIAPDKDIDRLSARGFVLGYVGSVILLLFCLILIQKPEWFNLNNPTTPARISFVLVGVWWISWAQITFRRMPKENKKPNRKLINKGIQELKSVIVKLKKMIPARRFLWGFLFYNAGVQTILYLAGTFAEKELSFAADELIILIMILQAFGAAGAFIFARTSEKIGNKKTLLVLVSLWLCICIIAYMTNMKWKFYVLATLVGLTMGGIQAISRATYAKLVDEHKSDLASFFSFYNVTYYLSVMLGTFSFGLISQWTGSMRNSILALSLFFLIGGLFLRRVDLPFIQSVAQRKSDPLH